MLDDVTVLDAGHVLAGPFCSYQLAMLGARVTRVENPAAKDFARRHGGDQALRDRRMGTSFLVQNANKRSLAMDLKDHRGRDLFRRLAARADVVTENFRPGVMQRLGLDYETLRHDNPRLVYSSLTGFGQSGPLAGLPAYDHIVQGISGMMSFNGTPQSGPLRVSYPVVDYVAGLAAALAVVTALHHRDRTGAGQHLDVAMLDTALMMMGPFLGQQLVTGAVERPEGNLAFSGSPFSGAFETADGLLVVTANTHEQAQRLCAVLGHPELMEDARLHDWNTHPELVMELRPLLQAAYATHDALHWERCLGEVSVPAAKVRDLEEALSHEHVRERGFVEDAGRVPGGDAPLRVPGVGFLPGDSVARASNAPPPGLGEHSREVLRELQLDEQEIDTLIRDGVVGES
jgi:crotonobetainyl-CoA:carnitine CoA-transferase CaiB-like acyl-CoA transferase